MRYLTLLGLMTVMAIGSARGQPRVFVAMPNGKPVMASEADAASLPLPQRIAARVAGLGHAEYHARKANREALKALLIQEGRNAYDMLNTDRYRQDDDPEIALTIREVLASTADAIIPTLNMDAITGLVAKGLTPQTLGTLNAGGKPVADAMLRAHLQMTLGVDVLYSLQPRHLLPEACRLLALQHEDYYRVLIAKAIEGVLARAIKPVDGGQAVTLDGMAHFEAHPDAARMLVALTTNACDELRLSALRICAYGQIPLPPSRVKRLQTDINPDVADEADRLHSLLLPHTIRHRDATVHDVWIAACVAALTQKDDLLAQLGAYNALTCLIDHRSAALYAAYAQAEGLAKDALGYILSTSLSGRLALLRHNQRTRIRLHPPHALSRILSLWDYDVKLKGLEGLIDTEREAVAPLVRRNLFVLGRSNRTWFGRVTWSKAAWSAAVRLGMHDLAPILKQQIAQQRNGAEYSALLSALSETKGERFMVKPAAEWYTRCATHLDAQPLDIRTGAVRSLMASGKAGAQALRARQQKNDGQDDEFRDYLKSLLRFHPYSPFLVDDTAAGQQLKTDLAQSGLTYSANMRAGRRQGSSRQVYDGGALRLPVALWAYVNNNDCNCMNPIGNYLAQNLKPIYAPLILSWLDHNSRMSIFLIEVDARDARQAVLRRLQQRRRDWGYCYDHDLFNYVVVYELLEALPFLEHYVKTNSNWPYKGIRTMAGVEKERYCWTQPLKSGRANPLVLPSCRELIKQCGQKHLVAKHVNEIEAELKQDP